MTISDSVKKKMESFTKSIRQGDSDDKSIKIYRDFIVSNVHGVLENTFPYFIVYAKNEIKEELIDCFLKENYSSNPAFHQIATELLKCAKKIQMPEELLKLIEFEWLLFTIAISDEYVDENVSLDNYFDYLDIKDVEINPTLTFISLPFDIDKLSDKLEVEENKLYGLYRNVNHMVTYQKLSYPDFVIINTLTNIGILTFKKNDFKKTEQKYKKKLVEKLSVWHNQNIIKLKL